MKLALAIMCSLMLAGIPFLSAQTPLPACCAKSPVPACCQHGGVMPCCAEKNDSTPQNTPAVPSQNNTQQNQVPALVLSAVICTLPETPVATISSTTVSFFRSVDAPLFARNCVRLI